MTFPTHRPRRLRRTEALRALVRETRLTPDDVVAPLFACPGEGIVRPVDGLPGIAQRSVDALVEEARDLRGLGVRAVLLFGIPEEKDETGSGAWHEEGIVQQALRALRAETPELTLITDVCLCEYTSHGHCGVVRDGEVVNDETLPLLARTAVSHVAAGADVVAPSDMMDGRVGAIRSALPETPIVSYAAKYASAFYGPFREVAESTPSFGDRRGYQMDPANVREALRECALDLEEGADVLMVKPALAVPRRDPRRAGAVRRARVGLPGLRRVRDGARGRGGRPSRRADSGPRDADGDPPGRCRADRDVLGARRWPGGPEASARSSGGVRPRAIPGGVNSPVRAMRGVGLDEPVFMRSGARRVRRGRRRPPLRRLGAVVGAADLRPRRPGDRRGRRRRPRREGTTFGAPTEAEVALAEEIVDAVPSIEMVRMVSSGHRGVDERDPARARRHPARPGDQVRRLLPRPRRRPARERRLGDR